MEMMLRSKWLKGLWLAGMRLRTRAKPIESRRTNGMEKRLHHSFWNCVSMDFCVTTKMRLPRPRAMSSVAKTPASSVLPKPTASAIKMRDRG